MSRAQTVSTPQSLTQDGEYAEQNGHQGVNADAHPPSASFALRRNPPGVTAARLQQAAKVNHKHKLRRPTPCR